MGHRSEKTPVERFMNELVSISKALSDDDLKHMKFIMGEHLPNGNLQSCKMPIELFKLMMHYEMLSETNLARLAQLLTDVKRKDLSSKLQIKVTDSLLKDLAREIGSQWRNLGELLKVSSTFLNRRPTQRHLTDSDTAKAMLLEWKKKKKDNATEAALQKVLQEAQMYPLWEKVKVVGFRAKLVSISKELSCEDLQHMKFWMKNQQQNGDYESVKLPIDLFELMMQQEMLSKTKLAPLAQMLNVVGRKDLCSKLQIKGESETRTPPDIEQAAELPSGETPTRPPQGQDQVAELSSDETQTTPPQGQDQVAELSSGETETRTPPDIEQAAELPSDETQTRPPQGQDQVAELSSAKANKHNCLKKVEVSYPLLDDLARQFRSRKWKTLGKILGLSESFLNALLQNEDLLNESQRAKAMLRQWKKNNNGNATEEALKDALKKAKLPELGEKFEDYSNRSKNLSKDPSKVPRRVNTTPVDDDLLKTLAEKLESKWKTFGAALGITTQRLKNIQGSNKSYPNNYAKAKAMLDGWKKTAGNNATKENLQKALGEVGIEFSLQP